MVSVNDQWGFILIETVFDSGIEEKQRLPVFRKEALMGFIRVNSMEDRSVIADILPKSKDAEFRVGDEVHMK